MVCPCPGCDGRPAWLAENKRKFEEWLVATGRVSAPEPIKEIVPSQRVDVMVAELRNDICKRGASSSFCIKHDSFFSQDEEICFRKHNEIQRGA